MRSLCDAIEKYLMRMIETSPDQAIVVQRGKLAIEFECAPSQINYVLATRFSVARGFIVESRRGGSGYVRIKRIILDRLEPIIRYVEERDKGLREVEVEDLVELLRREGYITGREAALMKAATINALSDLREDNGNLVAEKNVLRSHIFREMLLRVLGWRENEV